MAKVASPQQSEAAKQATAGYTDVKTGSGGTMNRFSRTRPLTRFERKALESGVEKVCIYNISPIWNYEKFYPGLGPLVLRARDEDKEYWGPTILEKNLVRTFDGGNRIQRLMVETPLEIVEDFFVCSPEFPGRPENRLHRFGAFFTVGESLDEMPGHQRQQILDEAELKSRNWMHELVGHADSFYNSSNMQYAIVEIHKKAALYLHKVGNISELPDWVAKRAKLTTTAECPFCGFENKRSVVKCRNCHEVLDKEGYAKLQKELSK